jgi:hypothetical protein
MEDFEHFLAEATADGSNIVPGVVVLAVDKTGTLILPITCLESYDMQDDTCTKKVQENKASRQMLLLYRSTIHLRWHLVPSC